MLELSAGMSWRSVNDCVDSKLEAIEGMFEESSDYCEQLYEVSDWLFSMKIIDIVNIIYIDFWV